MRLLCTAALCGALCAAFARPALADGEMIGPATYKGVPYAGSPQERAQEAILIFREGTPTKSASEDLILRVTVEGEVDHFAWVIPFPKAPDIAKEDAALFRELHDYVEFRREQLSAKGAKSGADGAARPAASESEPVAVISRKVVGSYDTAVVKENVAGALNGWLEAEGYQSLGDAEDVVGFYREKGYVFACIKVSDAALAQDAPVDLHPLRFTFETGGRDAMFFPMKMTGLQKKTFDVNLYVFYRAWLNDQLNGYGFEHRGFTRRYRDWDTKECQPNAGKAWSAPQADPFLRDAAARIPGVTALFQKLHPGAKFYLTNIEARGLKPDDVRAWVDDLWLFPYYKKSDFVPLDARKGGIASTAWPVAPSEQELEAAAKTEGRNIATLIVVAVALVALVLLFVTSRKMRRKPGRGARTE